MAHAPYIFTDWKMTFLYPQRGAMVDAKEKYDIWYTQPIPSDSQAVLHFQSLPIIYLLFNIHHTDFIYIDTYLKMLFYT